MMLTPQTEGEKYIIDNFLAVTTELLNEDDIGGAKPGLEWSGNCGDPVTVSTFTHPQFDEDVNGVDHLTATRSLKTKLKLEDFVRESLCLDPLPRAECKIVNEVRSLGKKKILDQKNDPNSLVLLHF